MSDPPSKDGTDETLNLLGLIADLLSPDETRRKVRAAALAAEASRKIDEGIAGAPDTITTTGETVTPPPSNLRTIGKK